MNRKKSFAVALLLVLIFSVVLPTAIFAADSAPTPEVAEIEAEAASTSGKSLGSGIAIGIAAAGGAIGMGIVVGKAAESVARQPEATGNIRSTMMLGLVFIETAIIYALLAVILIIFVL
ncbi:MAG: ATP synthase F0 subunit C [Ruminococcaceae bacterium]|nr:ATP synthase F0 subunit C [Oscillospiraceae bacterium]